MRVEIGKIPLQVYHVGAERLDAANHQLRTFRFQLAEVDDSKVKACLGERSRYRKTNTAPTAGDDGYLDGSVRLDSV